MNVIIIKFKARYAKLEGSVWIQQPEFSVEAAYTKPYSIYYDGDYTFNPNYKYYTLQMTALRIEHIQKYIGDVFRVVNSDKESYNEYRNMSYLRGDAVHPPFIPIY